MKHWYAIYTKSRQEETAAENLRRQAFEVYLPNIKQARGHGGQRREKIEPLFPRYLFIRLHLGEDNIAPIRSTHGVTKLVSFSGQPVKVPDPLIDALIGLADPNTGLLHPKKDLFEAGSSVSIVDGPLQGLEAIFKVHDGEQRSIILLELLGKTQLIKIDSSHLAPSGRD